MAAAQKENLMLCGLRGTMAVWHTHCWQWGKGSTSTQTGTFCPTAPSGNWANSGRAGAGTNLSMSFILASLVTLKKVNFCAAKNFGALPVGALKGLQQVLFSPWFLSGISLLAHKPSVQKHQTSSATPPCIFYLIPNMENHSATTQCPQRRRGSPAEINPIGTHEKFTALGLLERSGCRRGRGRDQLRRI